MKYSHFVSKLADEFKERFQDFHGNEDHMKMITIVIHLQSIFPMHHALDAFQLELINIFYDSNLKTAYNQHNLITFYKQ